MARKTPVQRARGTSQTTRRAPAKKKPVSQRVDPPIPPVGVKGIVHPIGRVPKRRRPAPRDIVPDPMEDLLRDRRIARGGYGRSGPGTAQTMGGTPEIPPFLPPGAPLPRPVLRQTPLVLPPRPVTARPRPRLASRRRVVPKKK